MLQQNNNNNHPCFPAARGHKAVLQDCRKNGVPFISQLEFGDMSLIKSLRAWATGAKVRGKAAPHVTKSCQLSLDTAQRAGLDQGQSPAVVTAPGSRVSGTRHAGLGALVTVATLKSSEGSRQTQTRCLLLKAEGRSYVCAVGSRRNCPVGLVGRVGGARGHSGACQNEQDGGASRVKPWSVRKARTAKCPGGECSVPPNVGEGLEDEAKRNLVSTKLDAKGRKTPRGMMRRGKGRTKDGRGPVRTVSAPVRLNNGTAHDAVISPSGEPANVKSSQEAEKPDVPQRSFTIPSPRGNHFEGPTEPERDAVHGSSPDVMLEDRSDDRRGTEEGDKWSSDLPDSVGVQGHCCTEMTTHCCSKDSDTGAKANLRHPEAFRKADKETEGHSETSNFEGHLSVLHSNNKGKPHSVHEVKKQVPLQMPVCAGKDHGSAGQSTEETLATCKGHDEELRVPPGVNNSPNPGPTAGTAVSNAAVPTAHPNPAPLGAMATPLLGPGRARERSRVGQLQPKTGHDKAKVATDSQTAEEGGQEGEDEFGGFMQAALSNPAHGSSPASWAADWTVGPTQATSDIWTAFTPEVGDPGDRQEMTSEGQWWPWDAVDNAVPRLFLQAFPPLPAMTSDPDGIPTLHQLLRTGTEQKRTAKEYGQASLLDGFQDLNMMICLKYKRLESLSQKLLLQSLHLDQHDSAPFMDVRQDHDSSTRPYPNSSSGKRRLSHDHFNRNVFL
ncbi:uncharacterized protein LOC114769665 isoform X2 [Denticeps clupeoides]|uniref:uncharacterized protein LOC114769665 isoform X2 n=1 Tax=Denticeps clupeoides TaxID=299321 RepID=UPI0010A5A008|nr:uncharacterized protein LOC114769665 isoform X2 [Denticeps clupeoides]